MLLGRQFGIDQAAPTPPWVRPNCSKFAMPQRSAWFQAALFHRSGGAMSNALRYVGGEVAQRCGNGAVPSGVERAGRASDDKHDSVGAWDQRHACVVQKGLARCGQRHAAALPFEQADMKCLPRVR